MHAIQFEEPQRLRVLGLPEPAAPGPGEALVRVHRVGICGTDYSGWLGKMPFFSYPRIPGHELGVEVLAVGDGVANVGPGSWCSVEPYINCQGCSACRRGRTNCCEKLQVLGVHTDGGLRPRFLVPARKLHPATRLTPDQLALVETLAIGCHAVDRAQPTPRETVLVIGAGPIGLSVIEFVKLTGANLVVMDLVPSRLEFCRSAMGVSRTIDAGGPGGGLEELGRMTDGEFAHVVIDATGNHKSMSRCLEFAAFGGRVVYVGITQAELAFPHAPVLHRRELTLLASRNALPGDFTRIIGLIETGRIDTRPWITHRTDFGRLGSDLPVFARPETGVIKAVVEVTG
jgi:2-desacetyl-2-hydroxyethyl bacteriochlorophyllide A dehydrogenase